MLQTEEQGYFLDGIEYEELPHPLLQRADDKKQPKCFRSDMRYFCQSNCDCRGDCKKLVARWLH